MATFINTAEIGLADEAAVTTANSGGGTGNFAFTVEKAGTGAMVVDNAAAAVHRGTFGFRFDCPAATDFARGVITLASVTATAVEGYFKWNGLPAGSSRFLHILSPSTGVYAQMSPAGKFEVFDNAGTRVYLSTAVITTGTLYRVSLGAIAGTTTTNGTIRFQFSSGANLETNTADEFHAINAGLTSSNTGTVAFTGIRFGHSTSSAKPSLWADDVQYSNSSSAIIGAPAGGGVAAPINSWTAIPKMVIDTSATSGSPTSQTLTQTSGPTVTITNPSTGRFEVTLPTGTPAVLSLVSTNAGGTDTDTITVSPSGASGATNVIRDWFAMSPAGLV